MGYSARYHMASLAAVFLALAIGILIGSEFGDDVVSSTRNNLENSLTEDLEDAQDRADELAQELDLSEDFAERIYPTLVGDRLADRQIGIVAFGDIPGNLAAEIETALEPTGGELVAVGVVREPADLAALGDDLSGTGYAAVEDDPELAETLAMELGGELVTGGTLLELAQAELLDRASGTFGELDGVIVVRDQPEDLDAAERASVGRLEAGLVDGLLASGADVVGVETTAAETSSIPFFEATGIASVDDVNLVAGQVAMVFSLLGAQGSFGVKDTADRLLPDLLAPVPSRIGTDGGLSFGRDDPRRPPRVGSGRPAQSPSG